MAKARAIVKRRKAVRNIRKITRTMQMIATAKFQKALKRATSAKPYTKKTRELVAELAASVGGNVEHPLLRQPKEGVMANREALLVITSNRGLAGAYNGNVLRASTHFIRKLQDENKQIDLYVAGKKGVSYFNFQKRPILQRLDQFSDTPRFEQAQELADHFINRFVAGEVDAVHVAYVSFISAGVQKAEIVTLLPLAAIAPAQDQGTGRKAVYDFYPDAQSILDELLPLTVKTTLFQCFLDATASENVARMVSMKSATENADEMIKSLTMQYNRARQGQITTELSEIMGGVEAMKG